ncbi:MAG: hypothetical protein PGN15_09970 [Aeromicrobium erythreum]
MRDVFSVMHDRLRLMLLEDDARFANWDQDATAVDDDYAGQRPADVAPALTAAGERLAAAVDAVPADAWGRTGQRSKRLDLHRGDPPAVPLARRRAPPRRRRRVTSPSLWFQEETSPGRDRFAHLPRYVG